MGKSVSVKKRDVDGTIKGVAVLVTVSMETDPDKDPRVLHSRFIESDDCPDPYRSCLALWESIKDDWPQPRYSYGIVQNERSRYLMTRARMVSMGFDDYSVDDFLKD